MEVELQRTLSLEEERDCKTLLSLCNLEEEHPYDTDLDYDFFYLIRNEGEKETGIAGGNIGTAYGAISLENSREERMCSFVLPLSIPR